MSTSIENLTDEQTAAIDQLLKFEKPEQTLGGYAGTGKTTAIKTHYAELPRFAVCAFTGKAANVLRRKGVEASTIHSLIYSPEEEVWFDKDGRRHTRVVFELRPYYELPCDGFIVDEASMVNKKLFDDLRSFERPIIAVGDHGQLPPVEGKFNLMQQPDITLETIHRNAGEIAQFADFIRRGNAPVLWSRHQDATGERVRFLSENQLAELDCVPDQIICAFNRTRVSWNKLLRKLLEYPADRPTVGDWVMCLQNDSRLGLFNGMQGEITALGKESLTFCADDRAYPVRFVPEQFNSERPPQQRQRDRLPFDYAYCVTCHKAQGDEWDHVMVIEEQCPGWEHARWAYTAASRAQRN